MNKPDLSIYVNYRTFLLDWSQWRMFTNPKLKWRQLAAELQVDVAIWHKICSEELHLSERLLPQILKALALDDKQIKEFCLLRQISKSKKESQQKTLRHQLLQLRSTSDSTLVGPENDFFASWIHPTLFSLLQSLPLIGDLEQMTSLLGPLLRFPCTRKQIKESLQLLQTLDLVKIEPSTGQWIPHPQNISTGLGWTDGRIRSFQRECIELSLYSLDTMPKEDRDITTLTLRINAQDKGLIQKEILDFKQRLKTIAENSQNPDEIAQFNIQLFPLSQALSESTGE